LSQVLDRLLVVPGAREVRLDPLTPAASQELLEALGVPDEHAGVVSSVAHGNPFLLTQLAHAPRDRLPDSARRLVLASLAGLPASALDGVRLVASSSGPVPVSVLQRALERLGHADVGALELAVTSGALQRVPSHESGCVDVVPVLLCTEVLRDLTDDRRALLHEVLLASWLDPRTPRAHVAALARHARGAGLDEPALEYSLGAALDARLVAAYSDGEKLGVSSRYAAAAVFDRSLATWPPSSQLFDVAGPALQGGQRPSAPGDTLPVTP
jgi:hypothetical protein